MSFQDQKVIPAIRNMKEYERFLKSSFQCGIILDTHISQLKTIMNMAKKQNKQILLHADLIHGLKSDEYATEYLCQEIKPYGILSTRSNVIVKAKQKGVLAIQRIFLLDSSALHKSYSLLDRTQPDCIELLPGAMPTIISEVYENIKLPILAGGFIRTVDDVNHALNSGATAITTSNEILWEHFEKELLI